MTNEFGIVLDRNGYAPSIVQYEMDRCYICGRTDEKLDRHEPLNASNRQKSKELGLWVALCRSCHEKCHQYRDFGEAMKRTTQSRAMLKYGWDYNEWRRRFGKSWL